MSASADVRHRQVPCQLLFEAGLFNEIWLVMISMLDLVSTYQGSHHENGSAKKVAVSESERGPRISVACFCSTPSPRFIVIYSYYI